MFSVRKVLHSRAHEGLHSVDPSGSMDIEQVLNGFGLPILEG